MPHPIQIKATEKLAIKTVLLSLVIGTLVGFVGIFFEMATSWVFGQRSVWVDQWFSNTYAVIAATFTVSALLADLGDIFDSVFYQVHGTLDYRVVLVAFEISVLTAGIYTPADELARCAYRDDMVISRGSHIGFAVFQLFRNLGIVNL